LFAYLIAADGGRLSARSVHDGAAGRNRLVSPSGESECSTATCQHGLISQSDAALCWPKTPHWWQS